MNLHTLLQEKNFGLYFPERNSYVRWIPGMASEANVDIEEGEDDFPVYLLLDIKDDDYIPVRADAEVERMDGDEGEEHVAVVDVAGVRRFFKVFKILTHAETFS